MIGHELARCPPAQATPEPPPMMHLVIHYGVAAGFEDDALALARRLFAHFDEAIDSLALIPVADDELDLFLNGRLVHSHRQSGRAPRVADVVAAESADRPAHDGARLEGR